jgi:hypothetical protein
MLTILDGIITGSSGGIFDRVYQLSGFCNITESICSLMSLGISRRIMELF